MTKRYLAALLLLVSIAFPTLPQQPQQSPSPAPPPGGTTPSQNAKEDIDDQDVVRIRTNLVQVDAVVTKDGKQVKNLTAEDFEIFEDGRKQEITNFSYVSNLPVLPVETRPTTRKSAPVIPPAIRPENPHRTIALVVDDIGISAESITTLKMQIRKFINEQMQPSDLVAIIRTGNEVGALQQFTTDKRLLHRAVDRLRRDPCSRVGTLVLTPVSPLSMGNNISLCAKSVKDTARSLRFIIRGLDELPGRKSLVIFSDSLPVIPQTDFLLDPGTEPTTEQKNQVPGGTGEETVGVTSDRGSSLTNEAALKTISELAIRASVVIYGVDTSGLQPTGITAGDSFPMLGAPGSGTITPAGVMNSRRLALENARTGMELISKDTGGFLIRNSNDFQIPRILNDQEGYYLIGYRPADGTFNRRFHHIKARVKGAGLTVRTREGFFGVTDEEARPPERTTRDNINLALMSPFGKSDIEVQLTSLFANTAEKGTLLRSFLYFQAKDLTFTEEADGWRQAVFDLSGIIFGDNGSVAHQTTETRTLRLRGKAFEQAQRRGLVYLLDIPVPKPGAYQFRVAVRDTGSSHIGTAGQFVDVPDLKNGRLTLSGLTISGLGASASPEAKSDDATTTAADLESMSSPAQRRFRTPSNLYFGYVIYNAQLDKVAQKPMLTASMRILRDGKIIYEGEPKPVDLTDQNDLGRITAGGGLELGPDMGPGDYVLQIVVTDALANEKQKTATQWIDFEIMK